MFMRVTAFSACLCTQTTHPLHQHRLIPVASRLLALAALPLVLVHHHGVDRVGVCVPVAESGAVIQTADATTRPKTPRRFVKRKKSYRSVGLSSSSAPSPLSLSSLLSLLSDDEE